MTCPESPICHCDEGWVCEEHPDQPFPHDDCSGPGVACTVVNPACPYWQGEHPLALDPSVAFDEHYAGTGLPHRARRMLKAVPPIARPVKRRRPS